MLQLGNGIPILNYFKGKDDNQLLYLEKYLMSLVDVDDVRTVNLEYFKLHEYFKYDSHDKLINSLYAKKIASWSLFTLNLSNEYELTQPICTKSTARMFCTQITTLGPRFAHIFYVVFNSLFSKLT